MLSVGYHSNFEYEKEKLSMNFIQKLYIFLL
jgi:hypothetical protein